MNHKHYRVYEVEVHGLTALYYRNGVRYGLHLGRGNNADGKMNGSHGPKHEGGDIDFHFLGRVMQIPCICAHLRSGFSISEV